jgi:hypothetical protein
MWTWHSPRHVFCTTALFTRNLDPTDVSRMAGRVNYRVTLDMYVGTHRRRPGPPTSHRITNATRNIPCALAGPGSGSMATCSYRTARRRWMSFQMRYGSAIRKDSADDSDVDLAQGYGGSRKQCCAGWRTWVAASRSAIIRSKSIRE